MEKELLNIGTINYSRNIVNDKLLGLVLCGGLSSRMGTDKGLLTIDKKYWAELCRDLLLTTVEEVIFSINELQLSQYNQIFFKNQLVVDSSTTEGPIRGILSVFQRYPKKDLFLLACDMVSMTTEILNLLYTEYKKNSDFDFYVFKLNGKIEPLCGIYTSKGLKKIELQYQQTKPDNYVIKTLLSQNNTFFCELDTNLANNFRNLNTPEDILSSATQY